MTSKKKTGSRIAKYFIRKKEEEDGKRRTTTDPSRMFQLNRMKGMGLGEVGPTHDTAQQSTMQYDLKTDPQNQNQKNAEAHLEED